MPKLSSSLRLAEKLKSIELPQFEPDARALLHPQLPKPLHGLAPRVILGDNWWNKERGEAYKSTGFRCKACGVHKSQAKYHKWLEGHEQYEIDYLLGLSRYVGTIPLCHYCHNYIHQGRLQTLLDQGKVSHQKFMAVIQHGEAILKAAKLPIERPYTGPTVEWNSWRLILFDNVYAPLYKSFEDWAAAMREKYE